MGDGSCLENGRAISLEGSTPSPSAFCALGRAAKAPVFQTGQAGSIPAGHSRGSANGRPAVFEAAHEGSTPSPRNLRCLRFAHGTKRARNVNQDAWLGRQSADHPRLKRGMLWVQLPPGPLLAFCARKHRANVKRKRYSTVRKPAKRPSSNLGDRLWVRFVLFTCV